MGCVSIDRQPVKPMAMAKVSRGGQPKFLNKICERKKFQKIKKIDGHLRNSPGDDQGLVSQNLSSVTHDSFCYKLLKSLPLIGYQQICH